MKKDRKDSVSNKPGLQQDVLSKRQGRREFLIKTGGILAAGAFGAVPLRGWAADPVNIGALYPTTGSMAQIGVGCVAAAKLAVEMVNEAGGIKSLGGAKLNLDHLRRAERHHGDAHRNRPADHRQQAVGDPRLFRQRAHPDRQRSGGTRQGAASSPARARTSSTRAAPTPSRRSRAPRNSRRRSCRCRSSSATSRRSR